MKAAALAGLRERRERLLVRIEELAAAHDRYASPQILARIDGVASIIDAIDELLARHGALST